MISSGGLGGTDQEGLDAGVDHEPGFFALVELQPFESLDHSTDCHLFAEIAGNRRRVLADLIAIRHSGHPDSVGA